MAQPKRDSRRTGLKLTPLRLKCTTERIIDVENIGACVTFQKGLERGLRHEVGRFVDSFSFVLRINKISRYTSPPPPRGKSPDDRSSSPQCVNLSYLYKHIHGYKLTASTRTHTASHAHPLTHMGLVTYSQNSLPPATESERNESL